MTVRMGRRFSRKTRWSMAIGCVTAAASTALVAFAPTPERKAAPEQAAPVTSMVASVQALAPQISLYGRVETPRAAALTALISAPVAALRVREGDRVEAGATLIRLDDTDARLLLRRRESDLAEAQADLETIKIANAEDREVLAQQEEQGRLVQEKVRRRRELRAQGMIAEEAVNAVLEEASAQAIALSRQRGRVRNHRHRRAAAEARVDRAAAFLEEARVALRRSRIVAPFAGRVTRVAAAPGELVAPGAVVAEIYDDRALQVRVQIPNAHLPVLERALAAGSKPPAEVDFGDYAARGELDRLAGAVAQGQSGVDGFVTLKQRVTPDLGRAVSLRIALPPVAGVVAVPVQSVYGQDRLFMIEDGLLDGIRVERVGETLDAEGNLQLLVRSPALADGVRILSSQLANAVTGLRVQAAAAPPLAGAAVAAD